MLRRRTRGHDLHGSARPRPHRAQRGVDRLRDDRLGRRSADGGRRPLLHGGVRSRPGLARSRCGRLRLGAGAGRKLVVRRRLLDSPRITTTATTSGRRFDRALPRSATASATTATAAGPRSSTSTAIEIEDACETGALLCDANHSGRVDGLDLARLALAFGTCDGTPAYARAVDLDQDDCVDGVDLAILAAVFGRVRGDGPELYNDQSLYAGLKRPLRAQAEPEVFPRRPGRAEEIPPLVPEATARAEKIGESPAEARETARAAQARRLRRETPPDDPAQRPGPRRRPLRIRRRSLRSATAVAAAGLYPHGSVESGNAHHAPARGPASPRACSRAASPAPGPDPRPPRVESGPCPVSSGPPCAITLAGPGAPSRLRGSAPAEAWSSLVRFTAARALVRLERRRVVGDGARDPSRSDEGLRLRAIRSRSGHDLAGWIVHVGNSPTNNGHGGDEGTTIDAGGGAAASIGGSPSTPSRAGAPSGGQAARSDVPPLAGRTVELEVCDQSLGYRVLPDARGPRAGEVAARDAELEAAVLARTGDDGRRPRAGSDLRRLQPRDPPDDRGAVRTRASDSGVRRVEVSLTP